MTASGAENLKLQLPLKRSKSSSVLLHSGETKMVCKAINVIQHRCRLKFRSHMIISIPEDTFKQSYIPFSVKVLKNLGTDGLCLNLVNLVINLLTALP